jgi:hypothetical protein
MAKRLGEIIKQWSSRRLMNALFSITIATASRKSERHGACDGIIFWSAAVCRMNARWHEVETETEQNPQFWLPQSWNQHLSE